MKLGEQGWELIAIMSNDVAYLRRQDLAQPRAQGAGFCHGDGRGLDD
jgi:hypothetical protein